MQIVGLHNIAQTHFRWRFQSAQRECLEVRHFPFYYIISTADNLSVGICLENEKKTVNNILNNLLFFVGYRKPSGATRIELSAPLARPLPTGFGLRRGTYRRRARPTANNGALRGYPPKTDGVVTEAVWPPGNRAADSVCVCVCGNDPADRPGGDKTAGPCPVTDRRPTRRPTDTKTRFIYTVVNAAVRQTRRPGIIKGRTTRGPVQKPPGIL